MQIQKVTSKGLKHTFKVSIAAQEIEEKLKEHLQSLSHKVSMPGFRPGKIPLSLIHQRYGSQALEETLTEMISLTTRKILEEHKLKQAGEPKLDVKQPYKNGKDFEYSMELESLPEIELQDLSNISLTKLVPTVEDKDVEEYLKKLTTTHKAKRNLEKPRPAKKGDFLSLRLNGSIDNLPIKELTNIIQTVELGSEHTAPEFEKALKGVSLKDKVTVTQTLPKDHPNTTLAGKTIHFQATVEAHQEPVTLGINDLPQEFGFKSLKDFKEMIKKSLQEERNNLARMHMKRHLLDILAKNYSFEVPPTMVQTEFDVIWNRLQKELDAARKKGELIEDDKSDDDLKTEYQQIAERRIRLGLLLGEIGKRHNIKVTSQDLQKAIMAEAQQYPGQEKQVFDFYINNKRALANLEAPIFEDKVVDFILGSVKIKEKEVDVAALMKEVQGIISVESGPSPKNEGQKKKRKK